MEQEAPILPDASQEEEKLAIPSIEDIFASSEDFQTAKDRIEKFNNPFNKSLRDVQQHKGTCPLQKPSESDEEYEKRLGDYAEEIVKKINEWHDIQEPKIEEKLGMNHATADFLYDHEINRAVGLGPLDFKKIIKEAEKLPKQIATDYLPILAFVTNVFKGNLSGRKIVEIGPGYDGLDAMEFFRRLGADTVGVDPKGNYYKEDFPDIKVAESTWEDMDKVVQPNQVDVIYLNCMTPIPYGIESRRFKDDASFERRITQVMNKALKPSGIIICHCVYLMSDYKLRKEPYVEMGYNTYEFKNVEDVYTDEPFKSWRYELIRPDIHDKYIAEYKNSCAGAINELYVYQKPHDVSKIKEIQKEEKTPVYSGFDF